VSNFFSIIYVFRAQLMETKVKRTGIQPGGLNFHNRRTTSCGTKASIRSLPERQD
jgi:hypothetical protein